MSGTKTSFTRGENPLRADKLNTAFSERVARSGDTMAGMLTLWADPANTFDAATKQYVDRAFSVVPVAPLYGVGRNALHNSLFNVQQRGVGPWTANSNYTFDRWQIIATLDTVSISVGTMSDADRAAIGDEAATFGMYNSFTGNAGATAQNYMTQKVENVRRLAGKTVTISLWAKTNAGAPKLGLNLAQVFGTGGSPSVTVWATAVAVTTGTAWARYTATITLPSISGKTLGSNGDSSTWLTIWYSCGATNNALAGGIGVQSGVVEIWGIQLEIGSVATPLEKPDPRYDLANCQRFYQTGTGQLYTYQSFATGVVSTNISLPVTLRATPTITPNWTSLTNASTPTLSALSNNTLLAYANATTAGTVIAITNYTLSADL